MTDRELSAALIRIADIGIVHFSESDILRDAAERIEILSERVAIMEEGDSMNNSGAKPKMDPTTGCAHIMNWENPAFGYRRCCSYCCRPIPRDVDERALKVCTHCGMKFDHAEDDQLDDPDCYD